MNTRCQSWNQIHHHNHSIEHPMYLFHLESRQHFGAIQSITNSLQFGIHTSSTFFSLIYQHHKKSREANIILNMSTNCNNWVRLAGIWWETVIGDLGKDVGGLRFPLSFGLLIPFCILCTIDIRSTISHFLDSRQKPREFGISFACLQRTCYGQWLFLERRFLNQGWPLDTKEVSATFVCDYEF